MNHLVTSKEFPIRERETFSQRTLNLKRSDGKRDIDPEAIVEFVEKLQEGVLYRGYNVQTIVRVLLGDKWMTVKGLDEDVVNLLSYDDYYRDKVADASDITKISTVQLTVLKYY